MAAMKRSHYQAPRTLADCEFRVGYRRAEWRERAAVAASTVLVLALFAAIGVLLAWRG